MSQLPTLTHLQFLVLSQLRGDAATGRQLRNGLREHGARKSGPAFYQLMARLEDTGLVEGWYEQHEANGQKVRERHYRLTSGGQKAWVSTRDFYSAMIDRFAPGEGPAAV